MKSANRRQFIQQFSLGIGASAFLPGLVKNIKNSNPTDYPKMDGKIVLFQGDSITDAGRDKASYYPNSGSGFGHGYAFLAAASIMEQHPGDKLKIYNRGISGHKVFQLANRWDDDCLNLQPDVLSILIGVNDFWHKVNGNYDGTVEVYENDYRALLERTKKALPNIKLIICEPFAVSGGTAITEKWHPAFDGYRAAAKKIAMEFKAEFVPFQSIFDEALKTGPASYWCPDGVHPSVAGAQLMAKHWVKAYEKL